MELGAFSVSLAVKDLEKSLEFYGALGFEILHRPEGMNYAMVKNGEHVIGLFQGMFDSNILTFNPGWNQSGGELSEFSDVRELQKNLKSKGIALSTEVDESSSGPGSFMLQDPDGNMILVDQHR